MYPLERLLLFKEKIHFFSYNKGWEDDTAFQVVICARNAEEWLPMTLSSIEDAMANKKWILVFGDDESEDSTVEIVERFSKVSSSDFYKIFKFKKQRNVATAKNLLISKALEYADEYKGVLLTDADDLFGLDRAGGLLNSIKKTNLPIALGSWYLCTNGEQEYIPAHRAYSSFKFGPWATLIHSDFLNKEMSLFYEELDAHEDLLLWYELYYAGLEMCICNQVITCYYNSRENSLSKNENQAKRLHLWNNFQKIKDSLEEKKCNILR